MISPTASLHRMLFFFPPNVVTLNEIKLTLYFQATYLEGTVIGLSSHQGYLT